MADHKEKLKIRWNESTTKDIHASVCAVVESREEISLLFGTEQPNHPADQEESIQLTDRVVLSPFTTKQLALALERVIRGYESAFGVLKKEPLRSTESDRKEKYTALFRLIKELNVEIGLEYSFKILEKSLLKNRFLLGVNKRLIEDHAEERIIHICRQLDMPQPLLETFRQCLFDANYVHFGFEENENTCLYKAYVEFWESISEKIRLSKNFSRPFLLHLGFKWDAFDNDRKSVTRYNWYPWLPSHEILDRVSYILEPERGAAARQAAEQLISLALARIPDRDILYLEVTDDGNPRRSFDINVYRANLQVAEVYPMLSMLCRRHSLPFDTFHSLYNEIKMKRFGHLAAGVDRDGESFFTAYYGVEEKFGESSRGALLSIAGAPVPSKYSLPARKKRITRVEETDDKARHIFGLVKGLRLRGGFEHSFKFLHRILLAERFLFGFKRSKDNIGEDDAIMSICQQIDMPQEYQEMFRAKLHEANIVLFGFERNEKDRVYKAYLEFNERLGQAVEQDPRPESIEIHTGFKWDVLDNSHKVVAKYTAYPLFRAQDMTVRVANSFYGGTKNYPYPIVDDILDLAGSRTRPGELLYVEVSEEGNPRSSFDINTYLANLQMAEIYPLLVKTARHYSIDLEQFEELYEAVKTKKFGHLSGGTDREGRDFLTVYFTEKGSSRR